ncbi:unnamed protein product [Adineta steineri]|uniref:Uncharacterized protein n=1 Tax=Adineta steineri TaxID=433720 RepID=A0A814BR01_9BILA|nr:unnamed protein product [Adineta steineri]
MVTFTNQKVTIDLLIAIIATVILSTTILAISTNNWNVKYENSITNRTGLFQQCSNAVCCDRKELDRSVTILAIFSIIFLTISTLSSFILMTTTLDYKNQCYILVPLTFFGSGIAMTLTLIQILDRIELNGYSALTSRSNNQQTSLLDSVTSTNYVQILDDDNDTENIDQSEIITVGPLPPPTIGARVSAMYQGARRPGQVINVNDKRGIFKMRFDEFPSPEFDYSFSYKSSAWSYVGTPPPSTTTTKSSIDETNVNENEPLFNIAKKFKALIKFMLPPDWELTREQVTSMNYDDLSRFDVGVFMQSYREKMTKIVEQRKADEAHWRTLAQRLQTEVTELLNLSGKSIPIDCSMEDFEQRIQNYSTQVEKPN